MAFSPGSHGTLAPLQARVLTAFRGVERAYLTGGSALGHFYLGHRRSLDLDVFTPARDQIDELASRLRAFCESQGLSISTQREFPGFRRFRIACGEESTLVDLVHDRAAQVVPASEKPIHDGIRIDAIEDIAANKLCALLGRAETKDLVDLLFLARVGLDPLDFLEQARAKDGGMEPATLAWVLSSVPTDPRELLLDVGLAEPEVREFRDRLVERLQRVAWPG